jgi:putative tricarboxylic transport membrane protein
MLNRRACLVAAAAASLATAAPTATAQIAAPARRGAAPLVPKLKIYIPAGTGGGWDQTGRHLGAAMQAAGLVGAVSYENRGGEGGTLGLADFAERHQNDPHALLVGGLVMVGALAMKRSEALKQVAPVARLTSDYMVLCSLADNGLPTLKHLLPKLAADVLVRTLKLDPRKLRYTPTSSGKEAIALLQSGRAHVAISGYSEFKSGIEARALHALAVSSRRTLFGVPSLREQGVDTELANWRAVFAPRGISDAQRATLRQLVSATTESNGWKQSLLENNWVGSALYGPDLDSFLQFEEGIATVITQLLKLKS